MVFVDDSWVIIILSQRIWSLKMAYINQEMKKKIAERLKKDFPNWSFRLKINNHATLIATIVRADEDLINIANQNTSRLPSGWLNDDGTYNWKNGFEIHNRLDRYFGENKQVIDKVAKLVSHINLEGDKDANYDDSDSSVDYFSVGYYTRIKVGGDTDSTAFKYIPRKKKKKEK